MMAAGGRNIFARYTNMPNKKIVLDTNCLLASISRRSDAYPVWKGFQEGRYTLCVTNEILEEYEEMIAKMASAEVATNVVLRTSTFFETSHSPNCWFLG